LKARLVVQAMVDDYNQRTSDIASLFARSLDLLAQTNRARALQLVESGVFFSFANANDLAANCSALFSRVWAGLNRIRPSSFAEEVALNSAHESLVHSREKLYEALQKVSERSFATAARAFSDADTELAVLSSNVRGVDEADELIAWMSAGRCACHLSEGDFGFAKAAVDSGIKHSRDSTLSGRLRALQRFTSALSESSSWRTRSSGGGPVPLSLDPPLKVWADQMWFQGMMDAIRLPVMSP